MALAQYSEQTPLPLEEAYQPNQANHEKYMTGMPATEVLYGYMTYYRPNSLHQAYLDGIPQMLEDLSRKTGYKDVSEMAEKSFGASEEAVEVYAAVNNLAYMYFTHMSHYIEPTSEELDAFCGETSDGDISVDFRQILLIPGETAFGKKKQPEETKTTVAADGTVTCSEELWTACEEEARQFLKNWVKNDLSTEPTFADAANKYSEDSGTAANGGRYQNIRKGQMTKVIDEWCFDPDRQVGDTVILRSDYGVHILYFSGSRTVSRQEAEQAYYRQQQTALIEEAKEMFPIEVTYSSISIREAEAAVSAGDIVTIPIAAFE